MSSSVFEGHPFLGNRRQASLLSLDPARGLAAAATAHAILSSNGIVGDMLDGGHYDPLAAERYWRYDRAVRASSKRLADEMTAAYESTKEEDDGVQDVICPTGSCTEAEDQKKREEQEKRLKELEGESGVKQKTKGRTMHGEKSGGMDQAEKDFDSLKPDNPETQNIPGKGKITTGRLRDGRDINVRDFSSDGRPTIEIRDNNGNGRGIEIRYNP